MRNRNQSRDEQVSIAERAAEWLTRLSGDKTRENRVFVRWIRRSPEHIGEMLLATSTDILLRQFFHRKQLDPAQFSGQDNNVVGFPQGAASVSRKRQKRLWIASASFGVSAAAMLTALVLQPSFVREWFHPNQYSTSVGEQRSIELDDGSAISINTQSSVRVQFSERARDVYLEAGQALFTAAKDASRPFRVHVGNQVVQAIGTKFDVWRHSHQVSVAVIEGTVQVSTSFDSKTAAEQHTKLARPTRVTAGQAVSIAKTGEVAPPVSVNVANVGAWQQRRLVFSDSTLGEIAAEFSRYNRAPRLRIEGRALQARRMSGVFDADSPEGLLVYLAADDTIAFDRQGDEIVIRTRAATGVTQ